MKNSSYKSVPVIASVIGAKSRKAMYLVSPTSLDGSIVYKDKWIPTSWNTNTKTEFRYTNKDKGIDNEVVYPGKYYKFNFKESVLLTDKGAVNIHGSAIDVSGLVKTKISTQKQTITWEYEKQSLIEFPLSKASDAMIIEVNKGYERGTNRIKSRLVDTKVKKFLQLEDRILIHVPLWLIKNFEKKFTIKVKEVETLFKNDNDFETVIEKTAYQSRVEEEFSYRPEPNALVTQESIDPLKQWELDNPEYARHELYDSQSYA